MLDHGYKFTPEYPFKDWLHFFIVKPLVTSSLRLLPDSLQALGTNGSKCYSLSNIINWLLLKWLPQTCRSQDANCEHRLWQNNWTVLSVETNNVHTTPSVDKSSNLVHFIAEWHLKLSAEILPDSLRQLKTAVKVKQRVVYFGLRDKLVFTVWRVSQRPTGHIPGPAEPWCCVVFLLGSPGQPAPEAGRWLNLRVWMQFQFHLMLSLVDPQER